MGARADLERRYKNARSNLLLVVIFSAVNILLLLLDTGISFLFSATFPTFMVQLGLLFKSDALLTQWGGLFFAIGFVAVGVYGLFYVFSKKHKPFMLVALVFFVVDTGFLLWLLTLGFDASVIIDIVFHTWVLWYLSRGVQAWWRLKKLSPDELFAQETVPEVPIIREDALTNDQPTPAPTVAIRQEGEKGRVILQQQFDALDIKVKRVLNATELIVNGMVYAEKKGLVEGTYTLEIFVESTLIKTSFDSLALVMTLYANGIEIARKHRMA